MTLTICKWINNDLIIIKYMLSIYYGCIIGISNYVYFTLFGKVCKL